MTLSQCGNFIVHIYMTLHKRLLYGSTNTRQILPLLAAIKAYIKLFKEFLFTSIKQTTLKRESCSIKKYQAWLKLSIGISYRFCVICWQYPLLMETATVLAMSSVFFQHPTHRWLHNFTSSSPYSPQHRQTYMFPYQATSLSSISSLTSLKASCKHFPAPSFHFPESATS